MSDYQVGYKEAAGSLAVQGQSGNPSGTLKPTTNAVSALEKTLSAPVTCFLFHVEQFSSAVAIC